MLNRVNIDCNCGLMQAGTAFEECCTMLHYSG